MADRRYIITADTGQAVSNVKKFADILNNVSDLPINFQKNMYNALNKAQKEIVKFGGDAKKLGVVFSSLSQTIQKNLDFLNKDMLPKEVITRFKDLEKSLVTVATNMEIVGKASTKIEKDTGSLINKISQYSTKLTGITSSANAMQAELNKTSNAIVNTNHSVSNSAKGLKTISNDYQSFSTLANKLSHELQNVTKNMYSLSISEKDAKSNLKALRVDAVMLSESMKGLQHLKLDIENADRIKAQLNDINNKIKTNETLVADNAKTITKLQNQYTIAANKISNMATTYDELGRKMQAIKSRGGSISSQLAKDFQNTGSSLASMKTQINDIQKAISNINSIQSNLARSTKDLQNTYSHVKGLDIIDSKQLSLMKQQVDLLNQQGSAAQKALTDVRAYNVQMATLYEQAKNDKFKQLKVQMDGLVVSTKNMTQSFKLLNGEIAETNKGSQSTEASLAASARSAMRLSQSTINASAKTQAFNSDLLLIGTTAKDLSVRLDTVQKKLNSLVQKPSQASVNNEIIRGGLAETADVSKIVNELASEIRNLDISKQKLKEMKNQYYENVAVIKQYRTYIRELQEQYDRNSKQLSSLVVEYNKLKTTLLEVKQSGGKVTPELTDGMQKLNKAITETNNSLNQTAKQLTSLKKYQTDLKGTTNILYSNIKSAQSKDIVSDEKAANLKQEVLALQSQARATQQLGQQAKTLNNVMYKQNSILRLIGTQFRSLIYDLNAVRIAFLLLSSSTGIISAIRVIGDFDKSMARVRSLMLGAEEATSALNVKFKALSDTVMSLGATTKFTAGQVADGAVLIAQAGFNAKESIEVLKPVLDLAVAGNIEMSESANTLTKTMRMFKLEAGDATNIADIYAATINKSQTNMSELANAMSYVGPVAESFGLSLNDTATYLGVLANNGISASKAGTSLRQLMVSLIKPTSAAKKILDAYGLSLNDLKQQGMSAEEALRYIVKTLGEVGHLGTVFRISALPSAEVIAKSNDELINMKDNLVDIDKYAQKVAENNMQNLPDQFTQLVSALQDTIIRFGEFTGITDGLTNMFKSSADAIRSWNTDMADLTTDLLFLGGTLLLLRGRYKNLKQAMLEADKTNKQYSSSLTKLKDGFIMLQNNIKGNEKAHIQYLRTLVKVNVSIKSLVASMRMFALASVDMLVMTAALYGVTKAIEYFSSSDRMSNILEQNKDLFDAARGSVTEYKEALDAISASARQMNDIQLTGKITEVEKQIEAMEKALIKSMRKTQSELHRAFFTFSMPVNDPSIFNFKNIDEEALSVMYETTNANISLLDDLIQAVQTGDSEEMANIMAEIDSVALKELGLNDIVDLLSDVSDKAQNLNALNDKLAALTNITNTKALKTFTRDFQYLINQLDLIKELSQMDLTVMFHNITNNMSENILKLDKFIPIDSFKTQYETIAKEMPAFAELIEFDREKGFVFNKGDLAQEIQYLKDEADAIKRTASEYEKLAKVLKDVKNDRSQYNQKEADRLYKEADILQKTINIMQSVATNIDNINENVIRTNFLEIWQQASSKIETKRVEDLANSMLKLNDITEKFGENFTKAMGENYLEAMQKFKMLDTGDIELGLEFKDIKVAGQTVDDYVKSLYDMIEAKQKDTNITAEQIDLMKRYANVFKPLLQYAYEQAKDKESRGRQKKEDDLYLVYLQSQVAIDKATNSLTAHNEELLKTYEMTKRINELQLRNQDNSKWKNEALASLKKQQAILQAQRLASIAMEETQKQLSDRQKIFSAMGIDNNALQIEKHDLDNLEKYAALKIALQKGTLNKDDKEYQSLQKEMELQEKLYQIENQRFLLSKQSSNVDLKVENLDLGMAGYITNWNKWVELNKQAKAEIELLDMQLQELNESIEEFNNLSMDTSPELERLKLLKEEIELRKENLQLKLQEQDPGALNGLNRAFRDWNKRTSDAGKIMEDTITGVINTAEQGISDSIMEALTGGDYDWSGFFKDIGSQFLDATLEMTTSKLFSSLFDAVGTALVGNATNIAAQTATNAATNTTSIASNVAADTLSSAAQAVSDANIGTQTVMAMTVTGDSNAGNMSAMNITLAGDISAGSMSLMNLTSAGDISAGSMSLLNFTSAGDINTGSMSTLMATVMGDMNVANMSSGMTIGGAGGGIGGGIGGMSLAAHGDIIKHPSYMVDNKGNITKAGEAGAEAILPVERMSNGDYGIKTDMQGQSSTNFNDFSIHITTTGSSGDKEKDDTYIANMKQMVSDLIDKRFRDNMNKEYRQGGRFYNKNKR